MTWSTGWTRLAGPKERALLMGDRAEAVHLKRWAESLSQEERERLMAEAKAGKRKMTNNQYAALRGNLSTGPTLTEECQPAEHLIVAPFPEPKPRNSR